MLKHILLPVSCLVLSACATHEKHVDYGQWDTDEQRSDATGYIQFNFSDAENRHKEAFKQSYVHAQSYAVASEKSGQNTNIIQSIYLVGGAYSAAAFLFESDPDGISRAVQDNLAGVGLAGGLLASFRNSISADKRQEVFSSARKATICIMNNSDKVSNDGLGNEELDDEIETANLFLSLLKGAYAIAPTDAQKAEIKKWVDYVEPVVTQANNYNNAYLESPSTIMAQLDLISSNVTKQLKGESISLNDAATSLLKAGRSNQKHEEATEETQPSSDAASLSFLNTGVNKSRVGFNAMAGLNTSLDFNSGVLAVVELQAKLKDTVTTHNLIKSCAVELTGTSVPTIEEAD